MNGDGFFLFFRCFRLLVRLVKVFMVVFILQPMVRIWGLLWLLLLFYDFLMGYHEPFFDVVIRNLLH